MNFWEVKLFIEFPFIFYLSVLKVSGAIKITFYI